MLWLCLVALSVNPAPVSLHQAVQLALSYNETALLAEVATQRAEAAQLQALSAYLPRAGVGGTLQHTLHGAPAPAAGGVAPAMMGTRAQADIEQPLVNVPAALQLLEARQRTRAAVLDRAAQRQAVALGAAAAYLEADAAAAEAAAEGERAARAADHLALAQQRAAVDLAEAHEVWVAEEELAEALRAQARYEERHALALEALAQQVGVPVAETALPEALQAQACVEAAPEPDLQAQALAQRPDLQALEGLVQAAAQGERAADLRLLPTLTAQTYAFVMPQGAPAWFVGAALRWQIFDGATLLAEPALRAADHRAAVVQAEAGKRLVHNRVQGARAALTAVCSAQAQAERGEQAANKRAAHVRDRYAAGLGDVTAVKLATDDWARARVHLARLRRDVLLAALRLRVAVGAPLWSAEGVP